MKRVTASCATVACPAVYEEDDEYIIVGSTTDEEAVPQNVADDEAVIRVDEDLLNEVHD